MLNNINNLKKGDTIYHIKYINIFDSSEGILKPTKENLIIEDFYTFCLNDELTINVKFINDNDSILIEENDEYYFDNINEFNKAFKTHIKNYERYLTDEKHIVEFDINQLKEKLNTINNELKNIK